VVSLQLQIAPADCGSLVAATVASQPPWEFHAHRQIFSVPAG